MSCGAREMRDEHDDDYDDGLTRWLQHLVGTTSFFYFFFFTTTQPAIFIHMLARRRVFVRLCVCAYVFFFFCFYSTDGIRQYGSSFEVFSLFIFVSFSFFVFFFIYLFFGSGFSFVKNNILQTCEPRGAWKTTLVARIRTWISHLPYSFGVEQFITSSTWSCRA